MTRMSWLAALVSTLVCLVVWMPARWVTPLLAAGTRGAVQLTQVSGTLWQGSAAVTIAPATGIGQSQLVLPERLSWQLQAWPLLLARAQGQFQFGARPPSEFRATSAEWRVQAGATALPAHYLAAVGAPLNSMLPGGWVDLRWTELQGDRQTVAGALSLEWLDATTRMSGPTPLGDYVLTAQLADGAARLQLNTRSGRLKIRGEGQFGGPRPQFRLVSTAAPADRDPLAAVLNMLGRRQDNEYILQIGS
jgi:general secretion pathway protein N